MRTYKGEPRIVAASAQAIFNKLTNPATLQDRIRQQREQLPEHLQEEVNKVVFVDNGISIDTPIGNVNLVLDQDRCREGECVAYRTENSPLPISMVVNLQPDEEGNTRTESQIEADLPFFLHKFADGQLEAAAERFAELVARIPY